MGHLLVVSSYEVGQFAQVAGMVCIPVIFITLALIVIVHYIRRKQPDLTEKKLRQQLHSKIKKQAMENEFKQSETDIRYLQDMLQEKQLQIEFLQNQLSQRIRNFHELEAIQHKQFEALKEKDIQLAEIKDQLNSKQDALVEADEKLQQQLGFLRNFQQQLAEGIEQFQPIREPHPALVAIV